MSTEPPAASRHSNANKSVNASAAQERESQHDGPDHEERIADKAREFAMAYPLREGLPVASDAGTELRADYADIEREGWRENQPDGPQFEVQPAARGEEVVDVSARTWGESVRRILSKYARTEATTVNLEKADWRSPVEHETFSIEARNRWFGEYQKKYNAQIDAWFRELTGGGRPSGGETAATFDEPRVALVTRSASSKPNGERVSPVEHANRLQESWEPTYHALRNTLRSLGYSLGDEWQYIRVVEPHTAKRGDGRATNACYPHEHVVLVVDGAVSAADLRPVVEKHVEACEWAGESAHGEDAIEVREPDELNDVAAYVADYCSIEPVGLWEREPEYLGFAAAMDAGNMRTFSRSEAAREAAKADACRQRAESDEAEQEAGHGEHVRREPGGEIVCAECGCAHDIEQDSTLAAHRTGAVATDGGPAERLREQWQDADAAASVGMTPTTRERRERVEAVLERTPDATAAEIIGRLGLPPDAREFVEEVRAGVEHGRPVSFDEGVPEWRVKSVIIRGEEHAASAGNGVEMVALMGDSDPWRPPHRGGRECPACSSEAVVSAHEAREVYRHDTEAAYWCSECATELGPVDGPQEPPDPRGEA